MSLGGDGVSGGVPSVIDGFSIPEMGEKLAGLPDSAIQDVGQNGTTSSPPRGRINLIGNVVEDDAAGNSKDVFPFIYSRNTADVTLADNNSVQNWLEAARDTLTVVAATVYEFEALIEIQGMSTGSKTIAVAFGGTATYESVRYFSMVWGGVALAVQTAQSTKMNEAATAMVLVAANTSAAASMFLKGLISINAAGTVIPQMQFSAAPGGSPVVKKNSFIKLTPMGLNTRGSAGSWA